MVGIVIVSHSSKIAEGVRDLAGQMVGDRVRICACGGNSEGGLGTDAERILKGIEDVFDEEGVLVLADLGSAILTAEQMIDFLPDERRERVAIANAPLVEGAVMAAVESSIGSSLERVLQVAEESSAMTKVER